jgi:hypothetical protein
MAHLSEPGKVFSMMGRQAKGQQRKMFYQGLGLERMVRPHNPLHTSDGDQVCPGGPIWL